MRNKTEKTLEFSLRQLLNYLVPDIKWYLLLGKKNTINAVKNVEGF